MSVVYLTETLVLLPFPRSVKACCPSSWPGSLSRAMPDPTIRCAAQPIKWPEVGHVTEENQ